MLLERLSMRWAGKSHSYHEEVHFATGDGPPAGAPLRDWTGSEWRSRLLLRAQGARCESAGRAQDDSDLLANPGSDLRCPQGLRSGALPAFPWTFIGVAWAPIRTTEPAFSMGISRTSTSLPRKDRRFYAGHWSFDCRSSVRCRGWTLGSVSVPVESPFILQFICSGKPGMQPSSDDRLRKAVRDFFRPIVADASSCVKLSENAKARYG